MMEKKGVLVVGSSNMDLVVTTNRFPDPGETVFGKNFEMYPGGKGANQAVCAARLGCNTIFIGKMGNDDFREKLSKTLSESDVDINNLLVDNELHTGTALITVDETGQNEIIVISGSNMNLTPVEIESRSELFENVSVVLTQLEIPIETVVKTAELAKKHGAIFILNPAPVVALSDGLYSLVDFITPNENELELLSGIKITNEQSVIEASKILLNKSVKNVIVTLGDKGCMLINDQTTKHFNATKVNVIDSTAAGDAFNGALAASLSDGHLIDEAIEFANKVASISVTRMGAQSSLPYLHEIGDLYSV